MSKSRCAIAQHVTNLTVSSCNCISTLMCESLWRPSKRSMAAASSLTWLLSRSISVCCCWHNVARLVGGRPSLACSGASTPPLERLLGPWRPGCSIFNSSDSFMKSIKWLHICCLTCSFTAGRVPFWSNQIPNVKKQQQQQTNRKTLWCTLVLYRIGAKGGGSHCVKVRVLVYLDIFKLKRHGIFATCSRLFD